MKYLILGGGPAGLTFANSLLQNGEDSFLLLEQEESAGGLCRSVNVDGFPLDIGGGHFLDTRNSKVTSFLFSFMNESEWNRFERDSRISIHDTMIHHPIEANLWQLDISLQVEYLKSIATAGCNIGTDIPEAFVEWIYWKLGNKIAEHYMLPYNRKMFGNNLNRLGTYWLDKLPNVSFEETLLSCLTKTAHGTQPGHAQFYYPKHYGFGELWLRMADACGSRIEYRKKAVSLDFNTATVTADDGSRYCADRIITTVPWTSYTNLTGITRELYDSLSELKYTSIQTEYISDTLDTPAHWVYYPEENLSYHRILVRHNFLPGSKGYWTETMGERVVTDHPNTGYCYMNQYAYPLNTINKPSAIRKLLNYAKARNIYGLGRWGEHQHYNSDVTVQRAMDLAIHMLNTQ